MSSDTFYFHFYVITSNFVYVFGILYRILSMIYVLKKKQQQKESESFDVLRIIIYWDAVERR